MAVLTSVLERLASFKAAHQMSPVVFVSHLVEAGFFYSHTSRTAVCVGCRQAVSIAEFKSKGDLKILKSSRYHSAGCPFVAPTPDSAGHGVTQDGSCRLHDDGLHTQHESATHLEMGQFGSGMTEAITEENYSPCERRVIEPKDFSNDVESVDISATQRDLAEDGFSETPGTMQQTSLTRSTHTPQETKRLTGNCIRFETFKNGWTKYLFYIKEHMIKLTNTS